MTHKKFLSIIVICMTVLASLLMISTPKASANYPKGSQIAGEYIEDKTDQEVRDLLVQAIETWQAGDNLLIKSEYEIFELSRTAFIFDIGATIKELKEKTKRTFTSFFIKPKNVHIPLHVDVNTSNDTVQQMKNTDYIHDDETLASAIQIAGNLEQKDVSIVYTNEDAIPFETIAEVTIDADALSNAIFIDSLKELDEHKISANDSFSLLQATDLDGGEEANDVAGKMYHLFLQSNFQVAERHSHHKPPTDAKPGLDAVIDLENNKDLVVVNPNDIAFIFSVHETEDKALTIALTSAYHYYTYDLELEEKEIEPRTVYRYDEDLAYGEEEMIQEGIPGTSVIVERLMYGDANNLQLTELISHDIYTLVPTIVLVSTTDEETAQEETVEEQVNELEEIVSDFEEELAEVKEEANANAEASEMITSLAGQLSDIQQQQAEFVQLIVSLQEQMNDNTDATSNFEDLYGNLEDRLTAIDEQLDALEAQMNDLD